ncbi:thioredoxin domain-containing protein (plasmid) [Paenibacillus urinalis]|uniref:Thioredoxin domain-containing protein n=1 Tax=Paenibacillus urinalis TaxID=521520 RepID=A0AAX3N685_9BACL|nr:MULTISPECIES: thioredoxin domain-containing protein [Paenibacillus]MCM3131067.1 DsbA family protein [Paenibacillus sp. MER 78]WDH85345.1 thioredoxin domain-containing protein [Paenibacillus urinalis]WDH95215.1 thioredoxin domain-containing protein [Paenibacillus urinalis]WDI05308.1 thioredoxin domain-containing protein [Paenibacillus urinalis]
MNNTRQLSKKLVIFTSLIIILLLSLFLINQMNQKSENPAMVFEDAPVTENQPTLGSKESKVSIVEFGDFKCPSCKAWEEEMKPRITKDFIETGKASFSYINVLFHEEESRTGALAAEAIWIQDPEAYWTFHKELFNAQPQTEQHDELWLTSEKVLEIAKQFTPTIYLQKLENDMKSMQIQEQVNIDNELVLKYNVQQTPTIMINNVMVSNPFDYDEISSLINAQLKE